MKKNSGVTLISLVEVIILLMIISSVTINVSVNVYDVIKIENFVAQMKVIQAKVDNIAEEGNVEALGLIKLTDLNDSNEDKQFFIGLLQNPVEHNINRATSWDYSLDANAENYYYFSNNDLKKIGLKDQNLTVIINFKTRNVIARTGVRQDGEMYYRQYDLDSGDSLQ